MPVVTGVVVDSTGKKDSRDWRVWSPTYAQSATGDVVSTRVRLINVTAGTFRASIDPGVVVLENPDGKTWTVTVPETDIDLWDLIALSVGVPPETPQQWVTDAVNAWLEDNPPGGGGSTDLTVSRTATAVTVLSSNGADATLPAADASNAGVMTATMQTKLAGIATGATANDTDANLKNRANHTGSQTSATISDFTEAVQDAVAALLAAGTNVTLNYDDTGNTLTVSASGGGGGLDAEAVRDTIGVALLGTGNISVTVNDAADTITVSTTATVNSTDAALRDRSTHTGTQSADTITDGTTNKAYTAADKTKLAGIASGATANDTDANLKNRANHTGTQTASTISDFNTAADARITAATGVSVQGYNANTTTLGNTTTGTGSIVRATSPTLVTPALGTPASGNLANCTFPTLNQSTTGNAATATQLATPRNINGVPFDGTANVILAPQTSSVTNTAAPSIALTSPYATLNDTGLTAAVTSVTVTGAADGYRLMLRFKDDGTSRTITLGSSFRAMGITVPTATTAGKWLILACIYNGPDSIFDVVAAAVQA